MCEPSSKYFTVISHQTHIIVFNDIKKISVNTVIFMNYSMCYLYVSIRSFLNLVFCIKKTPNFCR